ncbi:flavin-containing superfamily amine oxidase [Lecanosticta acicola]|uniref:Flavin-containing superfamily amine oxidase n=1 Tax=Lecanosticta acicola TaxID=111012 RepID=A0AAI8YUX1_9PEZI|nr:flavin-containing superfamily amine oxidase [Lecanosticta acicola]
MIAPFLTLLSLPLVWSAATDSPVEVVESDIVVIGGGGGGAHAAIKVQQAGKKVVLIERENRLGGHVNTYKDPATGQTYDYGVQLFYNNTATTSFFEHFDIPLVSAGAGSEGGSQNLYNFANNSDFPDSVPNQQELLAAAFKNYSAQLAKYPSIVDTYDLPDPVPEDLTISFGDFVNKYGLAALVLPASLYNQIGNVLALPTLYIMKALNALQIQAISTGGFVANGLDNNQLLYDRVQAELGSNVFLQSHVYRIVRKERGVQVYVSTPTGTKLIKACKLLIAIPPLASNLGFLDLDASEKELLSTFTFNYYYDSIVENTGLPANVTQVNVGSLQTLLLPQLPDVYVIRPSNIPGISSAYYGSYSFQSKEQVIAAILQRCAELRKAQGLPEPQQPTTVSELNDHKPYELVVTGEQIAAGFYKKLQALQGAKHTWWTGAAWRTHVSSEIWDFNEKHIIPELLK